MLEAPWFSLGRDCGEEWSRAAEFEHISGGGIDGRSIVEGSLVLLFLYQFRLSRSNVQ